MSNFRYNETYDSTLRIKKFKHSEKDNLSHAKSRSSYSAKTSNKRTRTKLLVPTLALFGGLIKKKLSEWRLSKLDWERFSVRERVYF